jgi:hypothetical protein
MHVLAALGEQDGPLSELMADYSAYVASGEINSTVSDAAAATEKVRAWAADHEVTEDTLDGLTLTHAGSGGDAMWWLNLRASNTEPLLRLNVEAADTETMERVRDDVHRAVAARDPALPPVPVRAARRHRSGRGGAGLHQRRVRLGVSLRRRHTGPAHRRGPTPRMTRP